MSIIGDHILYYQYISESSGYNTPFFLDYSGNELFNPAGTIFFQNLNGGSTLLSATLEYYNNPNNSYSYIFGIKNGITNYDYEGIFTLINSTNIKVTDIPKYTITQTIINDNDGIGIIQIKFSSTSSSS